jgi:hypothetical protein
LLTKPWRCRDSSTGYSCPASQASSMPWRPSAGTST